MIQYYKKTLIDLFRTLLCINHQPFKKHCECLAIQEQLIRKLCYIENRIRSKKSYLKESKAFFASKPARSIKKDEVKRIRQKIHQTQVIIKEYQLLIKMFRAVGDGLAFTYLNKYDIKPMAFKQSPGFISGKKGLRFERKILRLLFKHGEIAIMNDLTNCLRYADMTVVTHGVPKLIEAKKSYSDSPRVRRQLKDSQDMQQYLFNDVTAELFGPNMKVERSESHAEERDNIERLNMLINKTLSKGEVFKKMEDGLYYFAAIADYGYEHFQNRIAKMKRPPMVLFLNRFKFENIGYYPFTLSIHNPEALFDFYCGNIVIIIIADTQIISNKFSNYGLKVKFTHGEYVMSITRRDSARRKGGLTLNVSMHFLGRLAFEFVSLEWFIDEIVARFNNLSKKDVLANI